MAPRSDMRASDSDRDQVAERLRRATADGRLFAHELEERLAYALRARTYGELDAVVADLPGGRIARTRPRSDLGQWARPALALAIAIPVAMVLIAAVVFVLTGVFAVWMAWMLVGWWIFGRHHHHHRRHRHRGERQRAI